MTLGVVGATAQPPSASAAAANINGTRGGFMGMPVKMSKGAAYCGLTGLCGITFIHGWLQFWT